ncbi:hypothetical protein DBR47_12310 [Paucibacter sp. KBW04]|uniref:hypothetical protein n=1 Tax=Paucibacter sp. KBW04 TaxID=2153361 RepID=UPI000F56AD42|nr:hypothetical protein [Paucibacter sp. KBW04]RQO58489.1 hypothetical protein DBR47_12310 [Paucibacter sp. KBW04]
MFIPDIQRHPKVDEQQYILLRPVIERAANALAGWWPHGHEHGVPVIEVVPTTTIDTFTSMPTDPKKPPIGKVLFGVDVLTSGIGAFFAPNWTPDQTATLLLAHETSHLSEISRMRSGGATPYVSRSGFAQGMEYDMADEWKHAANQLAAEYDSYPIMTPTVRKAAHLVSELRADIRALNAMKSLGFNWPKIAQDLVQKRQLDEAADPNAYAISVELNQLAIIQPLIPERDASPAIWTMAFNVLAAVGHKAEVQQALNAAAGKLAYAPPKTGIRWRFWSN